MWIDQYLTQVERPAKQMLAAISGVNALTGTKQAPTHLATFEDKLSAFGEVLVAAENGLLIAGKLLVEMSNENPEAMELILQRYPNLTIGFLQALERVGLGKLDARVLFIGDKPVANRIASLPPKEQARIFDNPIPVVTNLEGSGMSARVEHLRLNEMTNQEKLRAIGPEGVRSPETQKRLLKEAEKKQPARYEVDGCAVYFYTRGPFTLAEITAIMAALQKNATRTLETDIKAKQIRK